jgi:HSP20 family molecular chaperone IbpA
MLVTAGMIAAPKIEVAICEAATAQNFARSECAISGRLFKRQFTLADHVEVKGVRSENGLLLIDLVREIREAMKPPAHRNQRPVRGKSDRSESGLGR